MLSQADRHQALMCSALPDWRATLAGHRQWKLLASVSWWSMAGAAPATATAAAAIIAAAASSCAADELTMRAIYGVKPQSRSAARRRCGADRREVCDCATTALLLIASAHGEKGVLAPPDHNRLRNVCPLEWCVRVPLVFPRP